MYYTLALLKTLKTCLKVAAMQTCLTAIMMLSQRHAFGTEAHERNVLLL